MIGNALLFLILFLFLFEIVKEIRAENVVSLWRVVGVLLVAFLLYARNEDRFGFKVTELLNGRLAMIVVVVGLLLFVGVRASGAKLPVSGKQSRTL